MKSAQQRTREFIILRGYNKKEKSLQLNHVSQHWASVLNQQSWTHLKTLWLGSCDINDNNISLLLQTQWPRLTNLLLCDNKLTEKGVRLLTLKKFPNLQALHFSNQNQQGTNDIKDEGLQLIAQKFHQKLTSLGLKKCGITNRGIQSMINYSFIKLKILDIGENIIGSTGIKYLIKVDLPVLENLSFTNCKMEMQGIKHLSKGRWPNLMFLSFAQMLFGFQTKNNLYGVQMIAEFNFKQLKFLYFQHVEPIQKLNFVFVEISGAIAASNYKNNEMQNSISKVLQDRKRPRQK